jgi:hypothetical protein
VGRQEVDGWMEVSAKLNKNVEEVRNGLDSFLDWFLGI